MSFKKRLFIRQGQELSGFRAILSTYLDLQEDYSNIEDDDYAFTHTEMTFVSMLSTAAIINGWSSVCEYSVDKIWNEDARYNSDGRGDIYLSKKNMDYGIYGEAKRLWLNMSKKRRPREAWKSKITDRLTEANEDVWRTVRERKQKDGNECGIGIGCLTFSVTDANTAYEAVMDDIWNFLKESQDEYNRPVVDALAMITVPKLNKEWAPEYPIGSILSISAFIDKDVHE